MKRIIVALDNEDQLTDESQEYIERVVKEEDANIVGVIKYPVGLIMHEPNIFIDAVKEAQIDTVIALSPEFIINELINDSNISKRLAKENIKIIDGTLEMELSEAIQSTPSFIKETIEEIKNQEFSKKENVLVITTDNDASDSVTYTEELLNKKSINMVAVVTLPEHIPEVPEYVPGMKSAICDIIIVHEIDKIVVYNSPDSHKFTGLLEDLSDMGIDVIHREEQEINMRVDTNFYGMKMN